jgi:hypothetical protein
MHFNLVFIKKLFFIITLVIFSFEFAYAKEPSASKKRTTINFEDELVEGEVQKPELMYLLQKKQFNFKRLIKLRKNFLPEMRRTSEDIQPVGSDS